MKVRWEWSAEDVEPGLHVTSESGNEMIIGYRFDVSTKKRYVLVDPRDGGVTKAQTKTGLAADLTKYNYEPGKR